MTGQQNLFGLVRQSIAINFLESLILYLIKINFDSRSFEIRDGNTIVISQNQFGQVLNQCLVRVLTNNNSYYLFQQIFKLLFKCQQKICSDNGNNNTLLYQKFTNIIVQCVVKLCQIFLQKQSGELENLLRLVDEYFGLFHK